MPKMIHGIGRDMIAGMAVRFVLGRAGTGKTHFLRDRLVEHVKPDPLAANVIYLVPRQATFNTQRAIATDPRLGGYTNVRIAAPEDVAETALVETGRPAGAKLDTVGRSLLIGHLLRQAGDRLEHFGRSAGRPGLAGEIDTAFAEIERSGRTPAELIEAANKSAAGDTASQQLGRKLNDLASLYAAYQKFLVDHQFDPFERQKEAPDALRNWPEAETALLLVDDFYDFTVYERQIIAALASVARRTFVALTLDPAAPIVAEPVLLPNELGLFRRTEEAYRRLHFALKNDDVPIEPPLLLSAERRWKNRPLAAVAHAFDDTPPPAENVADEVRLCLAADDRDEVETAAREIKRLLYQGYRLHDICVLARSADAYAARFEAIFRAHHLPYFLDRRRPAAHHPLVRTVQAIAQIVQTRWSHDGVFDLLKAGLVDVPPRTVDLLADYVMQHRLTASAWTRDEAWSYNRKDEDDNRRLFSDADLADVNAAAMLIRHAVGPLALPADVETPRKTSERVCELLAALDRLNVRQAVAKRIEALQRAGEEDHIPNAVEKREEEEQVWAQFSELCDRLHDLLGDVEVTGIDFFKLLQTSLDGLDLAVVPPTIDQVLIGSVDRTRVGEPKAVILIGLNECDFPLCQQERPILNDADRVRLLEAGLEVEPPTRTALLMERFLGYLALTRASERLVLIRTACDSHGQDCAPSPFWMKVEQSLLGIKPQPARAGIARITTPAQAVSHLLVWARHQNDTITNDDDTALYEWMRASTDSRLTVVRDRAWPGLKHANRAVLSHEVAPKLFGSPLEGSVSRFESFAACPFQHFARYGLRLQRPTSPEFTAMDLGNLYHAVLDDMVGETIRQKVDFAKAEGISRDDVRGVSRRLAQEIADQLFLADARSRFTLEQLDRTVAKLLRAQQVTAGIGQMRPAHTELVFGPGGKLPPVEFQTPAGHAVRLRGKIDRIDTDEARSAYSVIDYKLSGESLDYGYVAHGLMLQLLTYLLALREHGPTLFDRPLEPAAALYVKVLRGVKSVDHPQDAPAPDTEAFHLKEKPRGVVTRNHATAIDPELGENATSRVVNYKVKQNGEFYVSGNDGVEDAVLADVIEYVRKQIAELADRILGGQISVTPYLINRETACQRCDLQRVCRIDRSLNHYQKLPALAREEAIALIRGSKGAGRGD